jgi:hypothetical protein
MQRAEQRPELGKLTVGAREALAERLELLSDVGAAFPGHLSEPPLEPPPLGLERERLRIALGERLFETRQRRRVGTEKLFDLLRHRVCGHSGQSSIIRQALRWHMGREAHLPRERGPIA